MSKAIVIQMNGVNQEINVDRLSTPKVGGGRELWLPEDETTTGSVTVEKNGTVNASDAGLYGFHEAIIKVKSVTGKKGGKTYTVTVDDDGYLVYTEDVGEAVRIAVTTLPTYTEYGDGAYLNFTGIVVHAYDAEDNDLGEIPFENLIFPVTVAVYDPDAPDSTSSITNRSVLKSQYSPINVPFAITDRINVKQDNLPMYSVEAINPTDPVYGVHRWYGTTTHQNLPCLCSSEPFRYNVIYGTRVYTYNSTETTYSDGKSVNIAGNGVGDNNNNFTYDVPSIQIYDRETGGQTTDIAYIIIYGIHVGGTQIPVQWARTGDGTVLETSFGITVIPAGGHGDD